MCKPSKPAPLTPLEVERIVHFAAARVAARTRQDEDDLRAEARMRAPAILEAWSPALGVPPGVVLRRRLTWALYDISKRALRRARFHGSMPESDNETSRGMWNDAGADAAPEERVMAVQVLSCLPERERRVMVLRFWGGAENTEIAADLGVSVATIERDVASAMRRMRKVTRDRSRPIDWRHAC